MRRGTQRNFKTEMNSENSDNIIKLCGDEVVSCRVITN